MRPLPPSGAGCSPGNHHLRARRCLARDRRGLDDAAEGDEGEDPTEHSAGILDDDAYFDSAEGLAA